MKIADIPFGTTTWADVPPTHHPGDSGVATWQTRQFGDVRVRMIQYSPGYVADHWCTKGHIVLCLQGELVTDLDDGTSVTLHAGMSYQVGDGAAPHRSRTQHGARIFVVD